MEYYSLINTKDKRVNWKVYLPQAKYIYTGYEKNFSDLAKDMHRRSASGLFNKVGVIESISNHVSRKEKVARVRLASNKYVFVKASELRQLTSKDRPDFNLELLPTFKTGEKVTVTKGKLYSTLHKTFKNTSKYKFYQENMAITDENIKEAIELEIVSRIGVLGITADMYLAKVVGTNPSEYTFVSSESLV